MKSYKPEQLSRSLQSGLIEPAYLLFGFEEFLRSQAARAIAQKALEAAPLREFNESNINLANATLQQALSEAEQLPVMAHRRVVHISEVERLRESDEDTLQAYLTSPCETSVVLFIANEIDKRRRVWKILREGCVSIEFSFLHARELVAWARSRLKDLHATADDRTLYHLVQLAGPGLQGIQGEIGKLAAASLPSGNITPDMVDRLTVRTREATNFELCDRMMAGNRQGALGVLGRLFEDEVPPVMVLGAIASNYRRLTTAKELMNQGATPDEVFRASGVPPFKREEFLASARRADGNRLRWALERIALTDLALKTSLGTPRLQLEMLVCELT